MAFSLKSFLRLPTAAEAATETVTATTTADGASTGQRPITAPPLLAGMTAAAVNRILTAAETGEPTAMREFFQLVDRAVERDTHIAGVINGLVQAIVGLPHTMHPADGDDRKRTKRIADDVQKLFAVSGPIRLAQAGIVTVGLTHSIGPAEIIYDTSNPAHWEIVDTVQKPVHWFTYDRQDGRTPKLLGAKAGDPVQDIQPGKMIMFCPRRTNALQVKNSMGWVLVWAYVLKALIASDKFDFIGNFGKPIIYGTYGRNTEPEDIGLLRKAVTSLNSSFRGVFRDDLAIKFQEVARAGTDMHEKAERLIDEGVSKYIWANTLSTDGGGGASLALGKVHAEGKYDVVRGLAQQVAATYQRDVVVPYVRQNFGPDAPMPTLTIDIEEGEDLVAESAIVKNLADAGVKLSMKEVREKFRYSEPEEGEETVGGTAGQAAASQPDPVKAAADAAAAAASEAKNSREASTCPVHSPQAAEGAPVPRDAIDDLADAMLADYERVTPSIDDALAEIVLSSGSVEAACQALLKLAETDDVAALQALFTKQRTATHSAGKLGGEV